MSSEKKKSDIITGTSHTGNLQEALDNATAQVGHGQQWRLASIDGLVGGIVGNDVNVHIYTVVPSSAGGQGASAEGGADDPAKIPVQRVGVVERLSGPDICMDGAEYQLLTPAIAEHLRLRPTNPEAQEVLEKSAGSGSTVQVTGYLAGEARCQRMDVYHAVVEHVRETV